MHWRRAAQTSAIILCRIRSVCPAASACFRGSIRRRSASRIWGVPVPEDLITLPRLLKQYGYRTANIGKLHFLPHASRDHSRPHPSYGFDHLEIADEPGVYEDAYRAWVRRQAPDQMDGISAGLPPNTSVWQRAMGIEDGIAHRGEPEGRHDFKRAIAFAADNHLSYSAFVGERTTEFIEAAGAEPFFCIASFYSPHAPWIAPQSYLDMYDANELSLPEYPAEIDRRRPADPDALCSDEQLRSAKQGYYAMISEVDHFIGRILDALERSGKREETIIVFTSDHGEWLGDHLRFGKGYPADDAVSRVPLIISAPGAPEAIQHDGIVEAVDIVPTLLELAAVQTPTFMQGESLASLILGKGARRKRVAMTEGTGWKSLRIPRFRYLIHDDGRECLWDLTLDPGAYHDLAEEPGYEGELTACRRYLLTRLLAMERPRERTWTY